MMKDDILFVDTMDSPLGLITLAVDRWGRALAISFYECVIKNNNSNPNGKLKCRSLRDQLGEYFSGKRKEFDIKIHMEGTSFQTEVWKEILKIPWGKTAGYGELAARIGKPVAARAVGQAVGANPLAILVPCHRVITGSRKIGGYGGGIKRKKFLLSLEGIEIGIS